MLVGMYDVNHMKGLGALEHIVGRKEPPFGHKMAVVPLVEGIKALDIASAVVVGVAVVVETVAADHVADMDSVDTDNLS